jgi:hypothetical protein
VIPGSDRRVPTIALNAHTSDRAQE